MKLLIIFFTIFYAQMSKADKVITGSELETYKNAAIKAANDSGFGACNWTWFTSDIVEKSSSLTVVEEKVPVLVFTALNYKFVDEQLKVYLDYDLVRIYLKTDTEYIKVMDASVQAYNYELVNKGTLKDPVMVKELVLKRACPK